MNAPQLLQTILSASRSVSAAAREAVSQLQDAGHDLATMDSTQALAALGGDFNGYLSTLATDDKARVKASWRQAYKRALANLAGAAEAAEETGEGSEDGTVPAKSVEDRIHEAASAILRALDAGAELETVLQAVDTVRAERAAKADEAEAKAHAKALKAAAKAQALKAA